jgi:hypothetical protein
MPSAAIAFSARVMVLGLTSWAARLRDRSSDPSTSFGREEAHSGALCRLQLVISSQVVSFQAAPPSLPAR